MHQLVLLRSFLEQHFPHTVEEENRCTCGAANHVHVRFFRLDGVPAAVVIPEGTRVEAEAVQQAAGCHKAQEVSDNEVELMHQASELGASHAFSNPFGNVVYFDKTLLAQPDIVFCPRMFFRLLGTGGDESKLRCFRVPTQEFLELTRAIVLPFTRQRVLEYDDWCV